MAVPYLFQNYPMGPKLKEFLGLAEETPTEEAVPPKEVFSQYVMQQFEGKEVLEEESLIDLFDELLAMNLPIPLLKLADVFPDVWKRDNFRGVFLEGLASIMVGEQARGELCFRRAQYLQPTEPAPYVNLVQIFVGEERFEEAWEFCNVGIQAQPNHPPLWELLYYLLQKKGEGNPEGDLLKIAQSHSSWMGVSFAAEILPDSNSQTRAALMDPFYAKGERSEDFLIEFTGALGLAQDFARIPALIWQEGRGKKLPWKLRLHLVQAYAAMEQKELALKEIAILSKQPDLPQSIIQGLQELTQDLQ